jgi:hypothetical protein
MPRNPSFRSPGPTAPYRSLQRRPVPNNPGQCPLAVGDYGARPHDEESKNYLCQRGYRARPLFGSVKNVLHVIVNGVVYVVGNRVLPSRGLWMDCDQLLRKAIARISEPKKPST